MTQERSTGTLDSLLGDLLVLELGDEATQFPGKILADLGARVIKIEPPQGAGCRHRGPFKDDKPDVNASLYFWANNTSKESITLDLESAGDRQKLQQLAQKADFILEDYKPGYLASIGLGYEQLSKVNPRLIMVSVTPFGQTGPYKDWKGGDLVQWAMGGIMTGGYADDDNTPPLIANGELSYISAAHATMVGITMALIVRDTTGEGQEVDISIQEACSWVNRGYVNEGGWATAPGQAGLIRRGNFGEGRVQCKDGKWFLPQGTTSQPNQLEGLVEVFKKEGVGKDLWDMDFEEAKKNPPRGGAYAVPGVRPAIDELAALKTAEEMSAIGYGLGFTWSVFHSPDETMEDAQLEHRRFFQQVNHPEQNATYTYPGPPFNFSRGGWKIRRRPPLLGEDNAKLADLLKA